MLRIANCSGNAVVFELVLVYSLDVNREVVFSGEERVAVRFGTGITWGCLTVEGFGVGSKVCFVFEFLSALGANRWMVFQRMSMQLFSCSKGKEVLGYGSGASIGFQDFHFATRWETQHAVELLLLRHAMSFAHVLL